jgi:glucosamine-6-phosphate deaminase
VIIRVFEDKRALARAAAEHAVAALRTAILDRGLARIVVATGASQLEFLDALTKREDIDWQRVEMFHLDEYIRLPTTHPASFRNYLLKNLIHKTDLTKYHLLDGDSDGAARESALRIGEILNTAPVDIAFVGIGENGHLAFNDPPANFESEEPYLIVDLDEACRRQQVGEGWFADISEVPRRAISMSVRQIMKAREILVVVPDRRKAEAVKVCFTGEIGPIAPASILRRHAQTTVYLDEESASLLSVTTRRAYAVKT